jgi:NAD(P)-dependent dehydrogenase (short-subunit alcohol dehydrogenase family)
MKQKVILITGASSGIGFEAARLLSEKGHRVYGAARRVDLMEPLSFLGIVPLKMDVTDDRSMKEGIEQILQKEGRIDVLVNNAGYGYFGAVETVAMEEARRQVEVNLFGLAQLCQLVIPSMRKQHSGRIINISSVAGRMAVGFGGWYNVTKYSVEAISDAMRMELKSFGIDVVLIEPGPIKTDWGLIAARNLRESTQGTAYMDEAGKLADFMQWSYTSNYLSKPDVVAKAICRAALSRCPKVRYVVGFGARSIVFFHSLLPPRCWDWMMRKSSWMKPSQNA